MGVFGNNEADITMISYLLMSADPGSQVIRIPSDDTDVFVLLLYLHNTRAAVQMGRWDGAVWDVNATCGHLYSKCLQILGMH